MSGKRLSIAEIATQLMEPIAEELGLDIWDVLYAKEGSEWYLRFLLDKDGGININDCEKASRAISTALDEADPIKGKYIMEVSSPGIERLLTKDSHFQEYIGSEVLVRFIRPVDGQREFVGLLTSKEGNTVKMELEDDIELAFEMKEAAFVRLYVEF